MYQKNEFSDKLSTKYVILLMAIAYAFSFAIRMIWVYQFQDNSSFYWDNEIMINTNDGYFWAAGAQQILEGLHMENPRIPDVWKYGTVFFTVLLTKITPFSLETVILYMPTIISSLVVIPIILIARLYGQSVWGFFAALLGSIAWSYYNRTMTGYYDTDMFSAMAPMFILYFLMKSTIDFNLRSALYAALMIAIYPFLYNAGNSIVYAMGIMYALYMIFYHRDDKLTYTSIILVFFALIPFSFDAPYSYLIKMALLVIIYFVFQKVTLGQKKSILIAGILFVFFMYFGNVFGLILSKMNSYLSTGTYGEGLHFYGVHQTIREAGKIPFETFANRISGSQLGVLLALLGYIALVLRHRAFILALPLVGIGMFALWGGLRFTVYAVPIAALSAIYLFFVIGEFFNNKKLQYTLAAFGTIAMLYPNIQHIIGYKVPTVLNKAEVEDLEKLNAIASPKDYTLTWWDYGYPIWYYAETSTLIDGGKHQNDNFIISTIMQTSSSDLAANLSRLAVESYVESSTSFKNHVQNGQSIDEVPEKFQLVNKDGKRYHGGRGAVSNILFRNAQEDQKNPTMMLSELENGTYDLPQKTRDIYLYLPYRMMRIYPTVAIFGNLDLNTGEKKRKITFFPSTVKANNKGKVLLHNGIEFDATTGEVTIGNSKGFVKNFITTQNRKDNTVKIQPKLYHFDGEYAIVYMKSYGQFVVMDLETFNSMYVQMFMLGKYDKSLFELVVSSAYSKIYKLKR
ncbi:MAG: Oligosaccharyltransferase PglB (EC [uncultured Sulfurovum sp.]|uniref:Oligosaccharyltransferase PglB (EC) n=1 Tax=uncultured Sulfurovum sp. TaxID=269237 RepID=A0A6S6SPV9_9BACT|nr:MAG: Oligosaccharyltransferase PglB (EC [uncultured Sulfurovum sp.]